jgi:hypothetical protein
MYECKCYLSHLLRVSRTDSLTNCVVSEVFGLLGCSRAYVCQTVQEALEDRTNVLSRNVGKLYQHRLRSEDLICMALKPEISHT